jgi:hypothetical protein
MCRSITQCVADPIWGVCCCSYTPVNVTWICSIEFIEDIPTASHSPKGEWRHMRFKIDTVSQDREGSTHLLYFDTPSSVALEIRRLTYNSSIGSSLGLRGASRHCLKSAREHAVARSRAPKPLKRVLGG